MLSPRFTFAILSFSLALLFFSCKKEKENPKNKDGYVYTESNEAGTNRIIIYKQQPDGSLVLQGSVASGGAGTGALFGSQGALVLDEKHEWLYAVNAGANSVSSFKVNNDGGLTLASTVASGGMKPVSVSVDRTLLYVANQASANINGYKIGSGGSLTAIPSSNVALSAPTADPGQISFSPNGQLLYITERGTDKIASFKVNDAGVAHSPTFSNSAGITPFGFDFAQNYLVVANAHLDLPNLGSVSSYSLSTSGSISAVNGAVPNNQTAACWTITTQNGLLAFIANSFSNTISSYAIGPNGAATLVNAAAAPTDARPRDLTLIGDSYLYVLNVTAHTIGAYSIGDKGTLNTIGNVSNVPVYAAGLASYKKDKKKT